METRVQWAGRDARRRAAVEVMAMANALRCATCHGKKSCSCREVTTEGGCSIARGRRPCILNMRRDGRVGIADPARRCGRSSTLPTNIMVFQWPPGDEGQLCLHRAERLESAQARLPIPNSEEALAQSGVPHTDLGVFPDFSQSLTAVGCKTSRVGRLCCADFCPQSQASAVRDRLAVTDR
jgi:hypothetical protein